MKKLGLILCAILVVLSCSKEEGIIETPVAAIKFTLTIDASTGGSVSSTGGTFEKGSKVTVTATPDSEYLFDKWSDGSSENPREFSITSNQSITATFVKKKYSLTVTTSGEGTVAEEVIIQGNTSEYNSGSKVKLTAIPDTENNWEFLGWTGDVESTSPVIELDVTEAKSVQAKFMRYFDYSVPSFIWKNNIQPRLNLFEIEETNGLEREYISTTGYGIADFNEDGYLDIMVQSPGNSDEALRGHKFLLNNGEGEFLEDDTIFINSDFKSLGARKTIVGDFNNDNLPDAVRISGAHDVLDESTISISLGNGTYRMEKLLVVPKSQYHGFASGDLDNDGDLDIYFGSPGQDQGMAINNGDGTFVWKSSLEVIDNLPDNLPLELVQTVEILDYNDDGYLDLILSGSFKEEDWENRLISPTILWGNGTGKFDFNNKIEIFNYRQYPFINGIKTGNNDDIVVIDVNGDGLKEIIALYIIQIDNDSNNNGNTTMYSFIQIYSPNSEYIFENKTSDWFDGDQYLFPFPITWIQVRDIDNNGLLDIVETEAEISRPGYWTSGSESIRFEWNGSKFEKRF